MSARSIRKFAVSWTIIGVFCCNAAFAGAQKDMNHDVALEPKLNGESMIIMALRHIYGDGVERNHVRALMWFKLATASGYPVPPQYFGLTEARMSPLQIARAQAYAEICAESNYTECQ